MSSETTPPHCPQCQAPLAADAPQGLCPACLMAMASLPTDQDTLPLQPGDLPELADIAAAFPELEIVEKIGQGGMGVVFKARQPKLDRTVALKVLPKALAATPGFAERFTREGRVLARLSHPSIVTVHDFGESGGYCYLVMEYVDGVNLRQAMKVDRFTPEQALKVVPDICAALQAAHDQGVLHRDIKPENILLDSKGRVKIADFGIAKLMDDRASEVMLTQSGARLGTAPYMAPEQIEQPSSVDHRADIYSLGVVLYELLTGELPLGRFAAPSEKAAVSNGVDAVVMRALEKERGRRQQSAGEMKTQIESAATLPCGHVTRDGWKWESFEYKSKRMVWGLPLVHVAHGRDPATGRVREAHGFLAFGDRARGIFAFGGIARGWVACGGLAFGGIALGGIGVGLISISGLALALLFSMGGLSLGFLAMGGVAAGWHASGGVAIGWHAAGGWVLAHQGGGGTVTATQVVKDLADMPALTRWLVGLTPYTGFIGPLWVPLTLLMILVPWWARRQLEMESGGGTHGSSSGWERHPHRIFWLIPALMFVCSMIGWALVVWARSLPVLKGWIIAPVVFTGTGIVMFVTSIPLWLRLIPINPFYGVRMPGTMTTSKRWYDVNAHAGRQLFYWSLALIGAGIAGIYQLPRHQDSYAWAAITLTLVATTSVVISTLWWMRRNPEDDSTVRTSRLFRWGGQAVVAVVIVLFLRSFIVEAYKIGGSAETGITKGSHWLASRLDIGITPGQVILYENENGQHWLARVVRRDEKGLLVKRGGVAEEFFLPWNKVVGKLLFSHYTPGVTTMEAAETRPARPKPSTPVTAGSARAVEQKPALSFMRLTQNEKKWSGEMHDITGQKVTETPSMKEALAVMHANVSSQDPDACWLQLWFQHPDFEPATYLQVQALNEAGKPLDRHGTVGRSIDAVNGLHGFLPITIGAGKKDELPARCTIKLSYSVGRWEDPTDLKTDYNGSMVTNDWMLGGIGERAAEGCFVTWIRRTPNRQVQCVAHLKDGGSLAGTQGTTASGQMISDRAAFAVPLAEVERFTLRSRDIREVVFENVVLPPLTQ